MLRLTGFGTATYITIKDTIQITPGISRLIARIDEFKGACRALRTIAPDRLSTLRRVATIESIGSSTRIEGSRLTDREVERPLSNLVIQSFESRDEQEVAGYAELMDLVSSEWQDISFNDNYFKLLHLHIHNIGIRLHHPVAYVQRCLKSNLRFLNRNHGLF